MYSALRPEVCYSDISPDIVEHDDDIEVYQWEYDGQTVYRGTFDPRYMQYNLNVYWLYDENLKRIGLAEHDADEPEIYDVLWFYDNSFARFYQDPQWKSTGKTVWSMLSNEAYQDCLDDDFKTVVERSLSSNYRLITPQMLKKHPEIYECSTCGKRSLLELKNCKAVSKLPYIIDSTKCLYIDDDFVIYEHSSVQQLPASYEQEPMELQEQEQNPSELTGAESPQQSPQSPQ
jgi:hypothetical protein